MTTAILPVPGALAAPAPRGPEGDQLVVFEGIDWSGYEQMLRLRADRSRPRMIYLDGDLLLMSPTHAHERDKDRLHMFVVAAAKALRMRFRSSGSTTYRRRSVAGGIEPDQSFYLANAPRVAGKTTIDLDVDPPPDLAIEVVYRHSADAAVEVSRRLGVPEVWVCSEDGLRFLVLDARGRYAETPRSLAFPLLEAGEILDWIRRPDTEEYTDLEWSDDLAAWIVQAVLPRSRNAAQ